MARGDKAVAMCDRSGMKFLRKDLREEWTGMLVHKSEWEAKHPSLDPQNQNGEQVAIDNPRPDNDSVGAVPTPLEDLLTMTFGAT